MSKIVQEKFEVRYPRKPEGSEGGRWASDETARVRKAAHSKLNQLPPGHDICSQDIADIPDQPDVMSGESDVSHDYTAQAVKYGYTRRKMSPADDMYTREHNDAFYDEIKLETEDGVNTGFLERNNLLDRL